MLILSSGINNATEIRRGHSDHNHVSAVGKSLIFPRDPGDNRSQHYRISPRSISSVLVVKVIDHMRNQN